VKDAYFEAEIWAWYPEVYKKALHMTQDAEAAEELTQQTMCRAWRYRDQFKEGTDALAWLYVIARNLWRTHRQHMQLVERVHAIPEGTPTYETLEREGLSDTTLQALIELDEERRVTFLLHTMHGLERKDVARALNVPIGTVMSRIHRARLRLKEDLANYAHDTYNIKGKLDSE